MKKNVLIFLITCATSINVFAQMVIRGKVLDAESLKPVANASVYLNNTTIGMNTNELGSFRIYTSPSTNDLVVSAIGYEKIITKVIDDKLSYTILLNPKINILDEVNISADRKQWEKWGELFSRLLLSNDQHVTAGCKILNPNDIKFYYNRTDNSLDVSMEKPLLVEVKKLAYILSIDIDEFKYFFERDELTYYSTIHYQNLPDKRLTTKDIQSSADYAYYGSKMHFLRSLYQNTTNDEGFRVYKYQSVKNSNKERVMAIVQKWAGTQMSKGAAKREVLRLSYNSDSSSYYRKVMQEKDLLSMDTTLVNVRDFVRFDSISRNVNFSFQDTLMVVYRKRSNGLTAGQLGLSQDPGYKIFTTLMYIVNPKGIFITEQGYTLTNELYMMGNMSDRRISLNLPFDYDPKIGRKLE